MQRQKVQVVGPAGGAPNNQINRLRENGGNKASLKALGYFLPVPRLSEVV